MPEINRFRTAKFYVQREYTCPICMTKLEWRRRKDQPGLMMLIHEEEVSIRSASNGPFCPNSGKKYQPPVEQLLEIPTLRTEK